MESVGLRQQCRAAHHRIGGVTRPLPSVMIRAATAADAGTVSAFAKQVFERAFAADNDPANMEGYVASAFTPARQHEELHDPRLTYLIAVRQVMATSLDTPCSAPTRLTLP